MLLHILTNEPRMLVTIVQRTPFWVWVVLAALIALGISQCFPRSASLRRVLSMPIAMTGFSGWGVYSAFGGANDVVEILAIWLATGLVFPVLSLWLYPTAPAGARYHATSQRFHLPGSGWSLLLIVGIFMVKYVVGVELALQPPLAHDSPFALQVALTYGVFNGVIAARTARLLRLAKGRASAPLSATA